MVQMQSMSQDETQLLSSLREAWTTYGPALRTKRQLNGGMSWRQIGKNEYLCRYVQDPATGKKLYTSLGRRSTETEMTYNVFHMRRDGARQEIQANKEDVLLRGRLLKAHGLARLPASSASLLRSFWQKSVDQQLTLFCGASLLAYEGASEIAGRKLAFDHGQRGTSELASETAMASDRYIRTVTLQRSALEDDYFLALKKLCVSFFVVFAGPDFDPEEIVTRE